MECRERLAEYLRENGVPFEVMSHKQAYTMPEVAAALHVPGKQVAKVVMINADGQMVMLVIPSPQHLNLGKVRTLLGAGKVNLASEDEFADLFPDSATGAMPIFGNLYSVPVCVDRALSKETEIVFRVGTHRHTVRVAYADFAPLVEPPVGELTG